MGLAASSCLPLYNLARRWFFVHTHNRAALFKVQVIHKRSHQVYSAATGAQPILLTGRVGHRTALEPLSFVLNLYEDFAICRAAA